MLNEIATFVCTVELKSMSAASRELRVTSSSVSARIVQLENHLGVRLLHRTTRQVEPTEAGALFYSHALEILRAMEQAKTSVSVVGGELTGALRITAPLEFGRRFLAPLVSQFREHHPKLEVRLRLSDHDPDMVREAADLAVRAGPLPARDLVVRKLADCPQVLCASPGYLSVRGVPQQPSDLLSHNCLIARTHGRAVGVWMFRSAEGPLRQSVAGQLEADDGAVLTDWALAGHGIALKPTWEINDHLRSGALKAIPFSNPPEPLVFSLLYPTKRMLPVKARIFADFLLAHLRPMLREAEAPDVQAELRRSAHAA
jgi:DNA-binding transcriptional LysR family regulator